MITNQPRHRQILQDHAIDAHPRQSGKRINKLRQLLLFHQRIESDINLPVLTMSICQHPLHLNQSEVFGPGPGRKVL